jgi:hemolysin D
MMAGELDLPFDSATVHHASGAGMTAGSSSTYTSRWHDPLRLIQDEAPGGAKRVVLLVISLLVIVLIVWAAFGELDIVASTEGRLVPKTLIKIVQPAEPGVVSQFLVNEGDHVKAGQVLARLDTTLSAADKTGVANDLAAQRLQERRLQAELSEQPMLASAGDDTQGFLQVQHQYLAHRKAYLDAVEQERTLLVKAGHERRSALEILRKLEQTLPSYQKSADAYARLEQDGYISNLGAAEKQRDLLEKSRDLDAQRSTVAALGATIAAQQQRIRQLESTYRNDLRKELADVRARIAQLQPALEKTRYKESLMSLHAPQDGVIKDLATTTVGAVVEPGTVLLTLVPEGEPLYADISVRNEDIGFTQVGQTAQIKLAAYPFQKYGMLSGTVIHLSADAAETGKQDGGRAGLISSASDSGAAPNVAFYKARVELDRQALRSPTGKELALTPGMQVVAEINQGKRTVLEYLLSPVGKAVREAGRER